MNDLSKENILPYLNSSLTLHILKETDSTQNIAHQLCAKQCDNWTLVLAHSQSTARGRLDRKWSSPPGGLWGSLILKPTFDLTNAGQFGLVFSLTIAQTIQEMLQLNSQVKWPNDVWIGDKKICGILIESCADYLIAGFGINVNNELPAELQNSASSLKKELQRNVSQSQLCTGILNHLFLHYKIFTDQGFSPFHSSYSKLCLWKNKSVILTQEKKIWQGIFTEIDLQGNLVLKQKNGKNIAFSAGETSLKSSIDAD